jgi:hypothetical protein
MSLNLLVAVKVDMLGSGGSNSSVLSNKEDSDAPGADDGAEGETGRGTETNAISGSIALGPEVGTVNVTDLATDICHCQNDLEETVRNRTCGEYFRIEGRLTAFFSFV